MNKKPVVLIIGGGFSGTMVASHLLRQSKPLNIILADSASLIGRGVAYSTESPRHLLNVPAGSMSAFPDDGNHFLKWAQSKDSSVSATDFLPRDFYGKYLEEILSSSEKENTQSTLTKFADEVIDLETRSDEAIKATFRSGKIINVDKVIIAIGNFPPSRLPGSAPDIDLHPNYYPNPWNINWDDNFNNKKSLIIIGTGLTSADVIVELFARGFKGKIDAISTHGLLPLAHKPGIPSHGKSPLVESEKPLKEMVGTLRSLAKEKINNGSYWQEVMDDIRPHIQKLWTSLTLKGQKAFMRHLRPYWDVHRHRLAPEIGKTLSEAIENNKLTLHAGKISKLGVTKDLIEVSYLVRGKNEIRTLFGDTVINCTGPRINVSDIDSSLLKSLFARGLAVPDDLGIGLKCGRLGELTSRDGSNSNNLFILGSLRRGALWETTAVRELRVQAAEVSSLVLENLNIIPLSYPQASNI